jgi:hypothetical protein
MPSWSTDFDWHGCASAATAAQRISSNDSVPRAQQRSCLYVQALSDT